MKPVMIEPYRSGSTMPATANPDRSCGKLAIDLPVLALMLVVSLTAGCNVGTRHLERYGTADANRDTIDFTFDPIDARVRFDSEGTSISGIVKEIEVEAIRIDEHWYRLVDIEAVDSIFGAKYLRRMRNPIGIRQTGSETVIDGELQALRVSRFRIGDNWYRPNQMNNFKIFEIDRCPECEASFYALIVLPVAVGILLALI